ncbi:MAG: hypothetical protein GH151_08390 [Bacteroidetes bacterium]|nr:hypothetical protein [Bacteroidota bacterium]
MASIMFLVEEEGKSILMTGDGHGDDILKGLKIISKLTENKGFHVDVLKVQHHGSEYNLDEEFCKKITANHYVFCGNGAHENPDLRILETILNSRLGPAHKRSSNPETGNQFKFWFNSSSETTSGNEKEHMVKVENLVKEKVIEFNYCNKIPLDFSSI